MIFQVIFLRRQDMYQESAGRIFVKYALPQMVGHEKKTEKPSCVIEK